MTVTGSGEKAQAVTDLLKRAAGRAELIIHYQAGHGYELVSANTAASLLFEMPPQPFSNSPRPWEQLPLPLATYLAQSLAEFSGKEEEVLPEFRLAELSGCAPAYIVTVYHSSNVLGDDPMPEHWYLFCFERSDLATSNHREKVETGKLETIGELASGVAHDFNNLIMGIQANAESILADAQGLKDAQRNSVINIIRACASGTSLTRSLLGYAKRQPLTMTQFNLLDMVNDVVRIDALALDISHHLTLDPALHAQATTPLMVTGCYSSLSHCLLNLIKNAREAMPDGGTVELCWEGDDQTARLRVQDHGMGISAENLTRIFEPFYSTKKNGTGLGLAMVKGIMSQHEGSVEIASTEGSGTSVTLIWPRKTAILRPLARAKESSPEMRKTTDEIITKRPVLPPSGKNKLAFVIDDDELVRGGVQGLLEHLGYHVEGFGRGETALAALAANHVPKLILVDYHMPGMDGSEFIRYWYRELPQEYREADTQILLVSGHPPSQFQELIRQYSAQNVGLLQKPFSMETLRKKLIDFSALRSITARIRPAMPARPVPLGNPSMRNAVLKSQTPVPLPRPRIAGDTTKVDGGKGN